VRTSTLALVLQRAQSFLLAAGDRERAEHVWRELEQLATHTQDVVVLLWPLQLAMIRATLDGDLEETVAGGERLIRRADELGIPVAGQQAAESLTFEPLLYLGRPDEVLPRFTHLVPNIQQRPDLRAMLAIQAAHQGRRTEALEQLTDVLAVLQSLAKDGQAMAYAVASLLEAAVLVEDVEAAAAARRELAGKVPVTTREMSLLNVQRFLGEAARLLGERDGARTEYERSLTWATRIRHRPEVALTRLAMAELLLDGDQTERAVAHGHLDVAIEELRIMKMQPALERALRHKGLLHA
jgi:hypothetical protein